MDDLFRKSRKIDKDAKKRENNIFCKTDGIRRMNFILVDDTQVLEIKNGPYVGAEIDRKRF